MINCTFENGNQNSLRHAVVNVIVLRGNEILLEKRTKGLLEAGKWGLPGGFMERDETAKETAAREVLEETGWKIDNIELFQIIDNPDRPAEDRQNVCFLFTANAVSQDGQTDWESDEQRWFDLDALPEKDQLAFDFARAIDLFKAHRQNPKQLPILGYIN